jgi:3',5'-cyclic AMP phosphodiesterase CpdA
MESGLHFKVYHVMGNHDAVYGGWKRFNQYFGPAYYSFDYQGSHFVVVDNSFDRRLTATQIDWLKNNLAAAHASNIFVFLHRPLFDPSGLMSNHVMESKAKAKRLQQLFEKYKVTAVFAGHIHGFEETQLNGVTYIITGGGGSPLYLPQFMGGYYHYVRVGVRNTHVDYAVKRVYD